MELKTVQTGAFKTLSEALKEILTDANIEFTDSAMKIITMDPTQTILVHLKLEKNNFEYYHCKHKIVIGINMSNFFKLIISLQILLNSLLGIVIIDSNCAGGI
jgi:proliferating cell nuclear antigen